jgi:DNA-binding response OmpR family regulator
VDQVGILIIDDDPASQTALRQILDSEGWRVRTVPGANQALAELASGNWTLAVVNVALTGLDVPLFTTLKELALAAPFEAGHMRVRVLFLVPEEVAIEAQPALERERLPYALKPVHLHDFLERVSDLLLEAQVIGSPIRRVRHEHKAESPRSRSRPSREHRDTSMFASRQDYLMSEEEIAEFEKKEKEERKKKLKKAGELGRP